MSPDPFTLLEGAIWWACESYLPLTSLVKVRNRIRLCGTNLDMPIKPEVSEGDLPELVIFPAGGDINPQGAGATSHSDAFVQRYAFGIITSHLRTDVTGALNQIKWAVMRAIMRNSPRLGGLEFVRNVRPTSYTEQLGEVLGLSRAGLTWKGVIAMDFTMVLARSEIY